MSATQTALHYKTPSQNVEPSAKPALVAAAALVGTWNNINHATRDLVKIVIAAAGTGITVHAFLEQAKPRSESLRKELLEGSYRPSPLRRVKIPKPAGGERLLGIPTVQDRVVQQAFLQVLQPILDPTFSEHSEN